MSVSFFRHESEAICWRIHQGYEFFRDLQHSDGEKEGLYFIFLFSDDEDMNRCTLHFLPVIRLVLSVTEFMIITPYEERFSDGTYVCRSPHRVYRCTEEEMRAVCAYFICIRDIQYRRNTLRVLINGAPFLPSERLNYYIGIHGITKKDVVALAICLFKHVPTDSEVEDACRYVPVQGKPLIDWSEYPVEETDEIVPFPESVDIGLDRLIESGLISREDDLAICTVTKTSRHILERLWDYHVTAVLDNDREKEGMNWGGIEVYTPEKFFSGSHRDKLKIIVPTRSYKAICEKLFSYGYRINEQVYITYTHYLPNQVEKYSEDFLAGQRIYNDIRRKYPEERLYFITYNGIGDTYLAGMYLRERMVYDNVSSGVVLFISQTCQRVFSLLSHGANLTGEYVIGDYEEAMRLLLYMRQVGYDQLNVCNVTHSFDLIDPGYLRGYKGLDFNTMLQVGVYHAPIRKSGVGVKNKNADHIFSDFNLYKGNTVLIAPYAKSAKGISNDFWELLVTKLKNRGYTVCTNLAGDEIPIKGTIALRIDLEEIFDFVEKTGRFIGIRSGLCDLLSGSDAKKVVLYNICDSWGSDYTFDFFGLVHMGLGDGERIREEIIVERYEKCIEQICEWI